MAKIRDEVVGKRFLSVSGGSRLKLSKICEWDWRGGIIRACTHTDAKHPDLQVLVEYDDVSWQRREWVSVYQRGAFQVFLLEHTLVYAPRAAAHHRLQRTSAHQLHPALKFVLLVDNVGLGDYKLQPVEFLTDRAIEHLDPEALLHHQEGSACISACRGEAEAEAAVRAWLAEQDGQRILVDTPSVLVGFRVQVYRAEGTTQWYTAVIVNYNDATKELTVTDDTVLEEHSEDPCLLQIRLLGEGVVESILRGENVGITSRRSRSHAALQQSGGRQIRRDVTSRQKKTSGPRPHASPTSSHSSPPPAIGIKISNNNDKLTTNFILPVTRVQSSAVNRIVNLKSNININPKVSLSADLKIENYTNIKINNNNNNNNNNKNINRSPKRISENHKRHFTSSRNYNNNNKTRSMPPTISEDASPATPPAEVSSNGPIEDSSVSSDNSSDCPTYPDDGLATDESVVTLADNPLPTPPAEVAPGNGSSSLVPSPVASYPSKQTDSVPTQHSVQSSERDGGDDDARFDALCSGRTIAHSPSVKKDSPSLSLKQDSPVVDVDTRCSSNRSHKTKPLVNLEPASNKFSDVDVLKNSTEDLLLKDNIKYNNNGIDNDSLSSNEDVVYLRSSMPINSLNNPKISPKPKLTMPPSNSIHSHSVGSAPAVSATTGSSLLKPHHIASDDESKHTPSSSCFTGDSEARFNKHVNSPSSKHSPRNHSSLSPRTPPSYYGSKSASSPSRPCRDKEKPPTTVPSSHPRLDNSGVASSRLSRRRGASDSRPLPLTPRPSLLTPSASSVVPITTKPSLPSSSSSSLTSSTSARSADNSNSGVSVLSRSTHYPISAAQNQASSNSSPHGAPQSQSRIPSTNSVTPDLRKNLCVKPLVREAHIPVPDTNLPSRTGSSYTSYSSPSTSISPSKNSVSTELGSTSSLTRKLPSSTTLTTTSPPFSRAHHPTVTFTSTLSNSSRSASSTPSLLVSSASPLTRLPASTTLTTTSAPPRLPSSTSITTTNAPTSRLPSSTTVITTSAPTSHNTPSSDSSSLPSVVYLSSRKGPPNEVFNGTRSCISSGVLPSSTNSVLSSKNASISVVKSSVISTNTLPSSCSPLNSPSSVYSSLRVSNSSTQSSSNSPASSSVPAQPSLPSALSIIPPSLEVCRTSAPSTTDSHDSSITPIVTVVTSLSSSTSETSSASTVRDQQNSRLSSSPGKLVSHGPRKSGLSHVNDDSNSSSVSVNVCYENSEQIKNSKGNESGKSLSNCDPNNKTSVISLQDEYDVIEVLSTKNNPKVLNSNSSKLDTIEHVSDGNLCIAKKHGALGSRCISPGSVTVSQVSLSSASTASLATGDFRNSSNPKNSAVVSNAQNGRTTVYRVGNNGGGVGSVVAGVSGRAVSITATSGPAPHTPSRPASPPSVSITAVLRPQQPPQSAAHHAALSSAAPLLTCSSPSPASAQQHLSSVPVSSVCQPLMPPQPRMDDGSSDSGVSVSEPRSVSRSSVLSDERSSSAEVKPNTPTPQHNPKSYHQATAHLASIVHNSGGSNSNNNVSSSASSFALDHRNNKEVRVWRDPALLSQSEQAIRHIHPLQHSMSYQPHAPAPPHPGPHHPSPHAAPAHPSLVAAAAAGALPPALGFPHSHALHLAGLQPPLNAAAAAAYYGNPANMWKQLGVPPPGLHPSYHSLLPHSGAAQEEVFREFERSQQDRAIRRESEAREKERAKMERDKAEREKRLREEEERRIREEKERQKHQVTQHFEESMRLFEQKKNSGWTPMQQLDERRYMEQRHREELSRRHPGTERLVSESIYKAFRQEEDRREATITAPPPAHSKSLAEKTLASNVAVAAASLHAYPAVFASVKDSKHRDPHYNMHHDKPSVIVQPDGKYDKPHSISPKQAVVGRASPYQQSNLYKNYEIPPSPHRGSSGNSSHQVISLDPSSRPGSSLASSPHNVELLKTRPPQSSPHPSTTSPAVHDRYYPSKSPSTSYPSVHSVHGSHASLSSHPSHAQLSVVHQQPSVSSSHSLHSSSQQHPSRSHPSNHGNSHSSLVSVSLVPNPVHVAQQVPVKSKVNSPPPQQVYIHPEHTPRGGSSAHISHAKAPLTAPPPAHSGNRNHERIHPPPPHESRAHIERAAPFDARSYPSTIPSPHPKPPPPSSHVVSPAIASRPGLPVNVVQQHQPSHHIAASHPTQTQPLDLGRREDAAASPTKRRTQTPTPQDAKKPRLETAAAAASVPLLSKVPEPSPVYSPAMTTITSVENVAALSNISRTLSPAPVNSNSSRPSSQPPASVTPTPSRPESTHSPDSNSVGTPSSKSEPEKSNSPGPSGAGYVHKLKKAWLHRHESGSEVISNNPSPSSACRGTNASPGVSTAALNGGGNSNSSSSSHSGPKSPANCKSSRSDDGSNRASLPSWKSKGVSSLPNGHSQDGKDMDSSSTDSDDGNAVQKPKRGKGKRAIKRPKKSSDSNSESDKESDGSETSKKSSRLSSKQDLEPKKRGRKPKQPKGEKEKEEGSKPKKLKEELVGDPLKKPPLHQLKKTGESFLQDGSCFEVSAKLPKCRECRWTAHQRNKKMPNIFCRFYAFRRLRYTKNGQLAVAGFSDPIKDAYGEDLRLWVPDINNPVPDLDVEKSKFLITHVGDQLCDLVQQEKQATQLHMARDHTVAWKRVVQGVREMCDVCETTLFNIHWACSKCGFVVCIDCYKGRKNGTVKVWDEASNKERDEYQWLLCTSRVPHEQDKLMLTQIISGNALMELGKMVHQVRYEYGLPQLCNCEEAQKYKEKELQQNEEKKKLNGLSKGLVAKEESARGLVNGSVKTEKKSRTNGKDEDDMANSPLNFFANVALSNDKRDSESSNSDSGSDSDDKDENQSTLRQLLKRPNSRPSSRANHTKDETLPNTKKKPKLETLDDVISCVIEPNATDKETKLEHKMELKHFIRKYSYNRIGRDLLPIRIMTKVESSLLYPKVQHSWLCDGKLLRLHEPMNSSNIHIFQDQWKRGQPVMISGAGQLFKQDLWRPYSFSKDFGDVKNDLINCLTGNIVPNQTMRKFWDGFENYSKRLKDEKGNPMILKLKDWPPGDDFAEFLPKRFKDLMEKLPMGDYTRRDGSLNLAGRLPECFVKPDLGPKMYIAYGSALYPHKASTNLHLDISDAVNVMCYSGVPKDGSTEEDVKAALKAIDDAGCDLLTRRRAREPETVPGALWHIYHARDADKIRDLLNKVAIANGVRLEPHHDPIHDQSWYLDRPLRERLYKEYGVEGYSILQCMGDAVFIPAGAPHQVRNLHNCIKVAEDFVSPENVAHCFHLTQEFRHLSDSHTNHEDKLQIKNIIYHAMKDSVAVLLSHKQKQSGKGSSSNGNGSKVSSGSNGVDGSTSPAADQSLSSDVKIKREQQPDS